VDRARGLGRGFAFVKSPRAHFARTRGEERFESQQFVRGVDHPVEAGRIEPEVGEKREAVGLAHIRDFGLEPGADRNHRRPLARGVRAHRIEQGVVMEPVLVHVRHVDRGLVREQAQRPQQLQRLRLQPQAAHRLRLVEVRAHRLQHRVQAYRFLVARSRLRGGPLQGFLDGRQVGQRELGLDDLDVGHGIDAPADVHDIGILEAAHEIDDAVGLADVGEKLVAETLAFGSARDEPGDVHELHDRRRHLLGTRKLRDPREPRVGHGHDAHVRVDGAERIVLSRDRGPGERVEQRGLADVGQADNTASQTHFLRAGSCSGRSLFSSEPRMPAFSGFAVFSSGSAFPALPGLPALSGFSGLSA